MGRKAENFVLNFRGTTKICFSSNFFVGLLPPKWPVFCVEEYLGDFGGELHHLVILSESGKITFAKWICVRRKRCDFGRSTINRLKNIHNAFHGKIPTHFSPANGPGLFCAPCPDKMNNCRGFYVW